MCPVFKAFGTEVASPRAKANIVRHIITGKLGSSKFPEKALRQVAELCLGCRLCLLECPLGVDASGAFSNLKFSLASLYGIPLREKVFSCFASFVPYTPRFLWRLAPWRPPWRLLDKVLSISRHAPLPPRCGTFRLPQTRGSG